MTIDDWNEGIEAELDDMFAAGITSFKMCMTYPAMMLPDGDTAPGAEGAEGPGRHLRRPL